MANLTITVDERTLRRARMRALEEGTSVNAVLGEYLEAYAGARREQEEAVRGFLSDARKGGTGSGGRRWTRDEIYDERLPRSS